MEARYKPKKVVGTSVSKKPSGELLVKRKTLRHNFRPPTEKKRDLPPLTPLHRLQRFKAIRDKNLKSKLRKTLSQNILMKKMEQSGSGCVDVEICHEEVVETNTGSVIVCSLRPKSAFEKIDLEGQIGELLTNGHSQTEQEVSNGHEPSAEKKENADESNNTKEPLINGNDNVSQSFEDAQDEVNKSEEKKSSDVIETESDCEEDTEYLPSKEEIENPIESDRESSASSSTFTSNKEFLQSSSDDILEALPEKAENSDEDEEIDVDRISSTEDETVSTATKQEEYILQKEEERRKEEIETRKEEGKEDLKKPTYQPRIPRSVSSASSASSYKSAYSSLNRISGRRPVTVLGRKRSAEDEPSDRRASLSELSPRWRFFRSAVPGLWSPPELPSPSSAKRFRSIDDSMAVNVNDDSINYNINDVDLFSDAKEAPLNKKSRWGCNIM